MLHLHVRYWLVLSLQLIHLVDPADQVKCYRNTEPQLQPSELVDCTAAVRGCHEYVYGFSMPYLIYGSGCGTRPPPNVLRSQRWAHVHRILACRAQDACNDQLKQELLRGNRVCYQAAISRRIGGRAVACKPGETKCYFEKTNSPIPIYNAGCGTCPEHTLSCFTCEKNFCNNSDVTAVAMNDEALVDDHSLENIALVAEAAAEAAENVAAAVTSASGMPLLLILHFYARALLFSLSHY